MRTNIYIRKDNEDAWLALDNKSEWVNELLGGQSSGVTAVRQEVGSSPTPPFITTRNKDMEFCKHDSVLGFCKKGCR